MQSKGRVIRRIVILLVFAFSALMFLRDFAARKQAEASFARTAMLVQREAPSPQSAAADGKPQPVPDETVPVLTEPAARTPWDVYGSVYAENKDFVGWISVPGTDIDYPVMQTKDRPNYYLDHGFDRVGSDYGVPYIQEDCTLGVSDNLVIYGHNMKDGSMFAGLMAYQKESFYRENPYIRFDNLEEFGTYEILAVFKTIAEENRGFAYHEFVQAETPEEFDRYVQTCKKLAFYDTGVEALYGDRLITLSTCEYTDRNGRLVVVARQITE